MSFTQEEIDALGLKSGCNHDDLWNDHWEAILGDGVYEVRDNLLRLALAHPERAELALGEGWTAGIHAGGSHFTWCAPIFGLHLRVAEGQVQLSASGVTLPPEFLGAFQRAYRIAAAWQRIQEQDGGK